MIACGPPLKTPPPPRNATNCKPYSTLHSIHTPDDPWRQGRQLVRDGQAHLTHAAGVHRYHRDVPRVFHRGHWKPPRSAGLQVRPQDSRGKQGKRSETPTTRSSCPCARAPRPSYPVRPALKSRPTKIPSCYSYVQYPNVL